MPSSTDQMKRKMVTALWIKVNVLTGSQISLPGSALRTSGLELMGVGKLSFQVLEQEMKKIWNWMAAGRLYMYIERLPLAEIATAWQREDLEGKRLVIVP
jgi:NADPH2:quinone reductase